MNALPKNVTSRPWGTHRGRPSSPDPCSDSAQAHTSPALNYKNHAGHYWSYLQTYRELDIPPAAATPPGPENKISHTASVISPSVFVKLVSLIQARFHHHTQPLLPPSPK
jgi:hypothetical protein